MSPLHRFVIAVLLISTCSATRVLALSGEYPATQPIGNVHGSWPAALLTAINSRGRIAGVWVNANDEFFYRGDHKAFAQFVRLLAEVKMPLTLALHTTPQRRSLLGDGPSMPYDWTLLVGVAGWVSPDWKLNFDDPHTKHALRIDVWVDGGLAEDQIDLPAGVRLIVSHGSSSATQPATPEAAR